MSVREYIGARYVPLFADPIDWDSTKTYEPLTVVYNQGNSYTSRQYVPAGIDISNDTYWARTGNYNAQIEQYRSEVATFDGRITTNETNLRDILPFDKTPTEDSAKGVTSDGIKKAIDTAEQTNADAIANEVTRAKEAEQTNADAIANEVTRAKEAEQTNADAIANNADAIANEVTRAKKAEQTNADAIANNADAIANEVTRAKKAEQTNADAINAIKYKDQYPLMLSYSNYTNDPGDIKLYCSYDFINYMDCGLVKDENNSSINADAKNVCITNDSLYLVASGIVYKATDNLRNFEKITDLNDKIKQATGFANVWAVSLYYDTASGFLYAYSACTRSTTNDNFKIYGCRVDNYTLDIIGSPILLTLQGYNNVIDPFVIRYNNVLFMAFKDEDHKKFHIATGMNPLGTFTPNESMFSHYGEGFEAPKLVELDGRLIIFADGYGVRADGNTRKYGSSNDVGYFQCNGWFNVEQNALCNIIHFSRDINTRSFSQSSKARHPCYFKPTNFVKNLFDNTDIDPIMVKCEAPYAYKDISIDNTGAKYIVTNAPMLYNFRMTNYNCTVGYSSVFNQNCVTYIRHAGPDTTKIRIDSSIRGGDDPGPGYICTGDREICSIIAQANVAYPNRVYYS